MQIVTATIRTNIIILSASITCITCTEIIQCKFCTSHLPVYFVLPRAVEILNKSASAVLISLSDSCIFNQHFLPLAYWWVNKDWKKKGLWVVLSFLFLLCQICPVSGWLSNMRKKGYSRFSWHLCFLEHRCLLSAGEKVMIKEKDDLSRTICFFCLDFHQFCMGRHNLDYGRMWRGL